jgi:transcriptional regulator with XRE-family HTH domain
VELERLLMIIRTAGDFGILIREGRRREGVTQAELARRNGVTQAWLSWVENGKDTAEIGLVLRVIQDLGVEMDYRFPVTAEDIGVDFNEDDDEDYVAPYKL